MAAHFAKIYRTWPHNLPFWVDAVPHNFPKNTAPKRCPWLALMFSVCHHSNALQIVQCIHGYFFLGMFNIPSFCLNWFLNLYIYTCKLILFIWLYKYGTTYKLYMHTENIMNAMDNQHNSRAILMQVVLSLEKLDGF